MLSKLSEQAISILIEIKNLNSNIGNNALLVSIGKKSASDIETFINKRKTITNKLIELKQESSVRLIYAGELIPDEYKNPSNKNNIIYYNKLTSPKEKIKNLKQNLKTFTVSDILLGEIYSFPDCCIKTYPNGEGSKKSKYTQHVWCTKNCKESIKLEKRYKKTINQYFL